MNNEKIVDKLNFVITEVQREIDNSKEPTKDLNSLLKKVIKNCEVSIKLIQDYQKSKDERLMAISD